MKKTSCNCGAFEYVELGEFRIGDDAFPVCIPCWTKKDIDEAKKAGAKLKRDLGWDDDEHDEAKPTDE